MYTSYCIISRATHVQNAHKVYPSLTWVLEFQGKQQKDVFYLMFCANLSLKHIQ